MEEKEPLIILTGPTAVGKTDLSLKLAKGWTGKLSLQIPCRYTGRWISDPQKLKAGICRESPIT